MNRSKVLGFAVGPIGAAVLGFVSLPASTWMFGAADIGRVAMLQTVTNLAIIVFGMGLDQSYLREYNGAGNRVALFRKAMLPGLAALMLVALVSVLLAPGLLTRSIFGREISHFDLVIVLVVLAAYCSRYFSLILRMQERGLAFSMSQVLPKLFFLASLLGLYLSREPRSLGQLLGIHTLSFVAATLIFAWNTRRTWLAAAASVDTIALRAMFAYGAPLMVSGLLFWGVEAMDKVALRILSDFRELGNYSVAVGIASVAGTLAVLFTTIWIPTAYRWADEPDCGERIEALARRVVVLGATIISAAGACTWTLRFLLPQEFAAVQYLVCVCMAPPVLYACAEVTGIGAGIMRRNLAVLGSSALACALNVALVFALVPVLGATGAATATAASFLVMFFLRTEVSIRQWRPMQRRALYLPMAAITACSILFALTGPLAPTYWIIAWHLLAIGFVLRFRALFVELFNKLARHANTSGAVAQPEGALPAGAGQGEVKV
ncbi:lipopolysaccharide biosynthesis protein [Massilia sp. TSP1-1-2]|uniref:lipopolysaccharide biosynthesis protein n=1 Tax=Massilia sp. TSP1-1-2 TaxID=2804649 RepID=UPI003CE9D39D